MASWRSYGQNAWTGYAQSCQTLRPPGLSVVSADFAGVRRVSGGLGEAYSGDLAEFQKLQTGRYPGDTCRAGEQPAFSYYRIDSIGAYEASGTERAGLD